jgi:hypothetical protein
MRGPTLALIIGIVVVVIATVIALQQISQTQTKTATPTQTPTPTSPSTGTAPTTGIEFDPRLAEKGKLYFTKKIQCINYHSIKSLGISGGGNIANICCA